MLLIKSIKIKKKDSPSVFQCHSTMKFSESSRLFMTLTSVLVTLVNKFNFSLDYNRPWPTVSLSNQEFWVNKDIGQPAWS